MKFSIITIALIMISTPALHSQNARIKGIVTGNQQLLEHVSIQLKGEEIIKNTITGNKGDFIFDELSDGDYVLTTYLVGYKSVSETLSITDGASKELNLSMDEDPLLLDQLVITGTRKEVPNHNSPVIVDRITASTFKQTQSLNLAEGLVFSPGLRVENNCSNCGFTQVRMNGLDGAYSQILINSRPVFSALTGVYGLELVPPNMIDRIEVVKGGGSVMYGGNAIAGTINIITREPIENQFEISLNQGIIGGEASDRAVNFSTSIVSDNLESGVTLYGFNRNRDYWDANGDGFSEITLLQSNSIGFDAFWNLTERQKIKANGYSLNEYRRGGNKFDLKPYQTDITEEVSHQIMGAGLTYDWFSANYKHKLSLYSSGQYTSRESYYGAGGRVLTDQDILTADDILALNAFGNSNDISLINGFTYSNEVIQGLNFRLGSEYIYNDVLDQMPAYSREIDQRLGIWGTYLEAEWDITETLSVLGGTRLDQVTILGNYTFQDENFINDITMQQLAPRVTAKYNVKPNLKLRASYAQGYRAPQAFDEDLHIEIVGGGALFTALAPDLRAETSNNFSFSADYTFISGMIESNLVVEGFHISLTNPFILSGQQETESGVAVITKRNGDGAYVQGINFESNTAFTSNLILQIGATAQMAAYKNVEEIWAPENADEQATITKRLLRTPDFYGFFTLDYKEIENLNISLSGAYTGSMDVPHVIEAETERTIIKETPDFFELNSRVSY